MARVGTALLAVDGPRIVGWNNPGLTSNQAIDFAIGQPSTIARTANNGGVSASTLSARVTAMSVYNNKLIVVDADNNRVLIWNNITSSLATNSAASVVIGQADMVSAVGGNTSTQMLRPFGLAVVGGRLFISDRGNSRLLIYNAIPTSNGVAADKIVDTRTLFKFQLPTWFDTSILTPGYLGYSAGKLYLGMYERILIVPADIF